MSPLDRLRAALERRGCQPRGCGDKLFAHCPAHDDRNASLSADTGRDGRALVTCHAGCPSEDVLAELGLDWQDLFDDAPKPWTLDGLRRTGAHVERDGRVRLGGIRYLPGAPAGARKALAESGSTRDLWPDPATVPGDALYVVEGEPDAQTGATLELPTVAVPGAAKWRAEWARRLAAGRQRVVVIADCDEAGRRFAQRIAVAVAEHCPDVRVLDLAPEREDGYDLSDLAAEAHDEHERREAVQLVRRAAGHAAPVAAGEPKYNPPTKLRRLDVAKMVREEPPPVPWIVEGLVVRGTLTLLNGREGAGKSLLAMSLAAGVATGQAEAGMACARGRVMVVDAENGPYEIHRRVRTLDLPTAGVEVFEADALDLRHDLDALGRLLRDHRPDLLILDSLRSLWRGDENDSREAAGLLDPLRNLIREHQAGGLLLHHSGKANGADYRGSSAIGASVELGFKLAREPKDRDRRRRFLSCWKCRPAPEPDRRWLRLAVEHGQVFIDEAEAPASAQPTDEEAAPIRDELRPQVLATLDGHPRSRADVARAVGRDPKDRSVGRVLEALAGAGLAVKTEAGWRGGNPSDPRAPATPATLPKTPAVARETGVATHPATPKDAAGGGADA